MIARKKVKEMNKFVMDSFNRDGMYCCNNDTVTIDTDFGEAITGIKGLKICPSDDMGIGVNIKDRLEDYVRKDEIEDLINKMNELYNAKVADKDDVGDAFRLLSRRLSEGNKKKNENSFLNYEKEVVGYELLYDAK